MADELVKQGRLVTVFGGSGFLGRHVVRALARRGWRVRVASRRPDLAFHLQPSGKVGQIHAVQANLRYPDSIVHALRDAEAVVNLVGVLSEAGAQRFDAVHNLGAQAIAKLSEDAGIETFVHVSAIGADPDAASEYARSKGLGEQAVRIFRPKAVILRPSVVFGPEDDFFNRFATMARFLPALPLIGGGATKLQPVFVGDVAEAVALAVDGKAEPRTTYELGGPDIATLRRIIEFVLSVTERKRWLVSVPVTEAKMIAGVTEFAKKASLGLFPDFLTITGDQIALLQSDNVVSKEAIDEGRTLQGLGLAPESFEAFVPSYLYRYRKAGQFADRRAV
ncbi:complex I NDUFA9 subunit family protein [Methylocapsa acidiphila]|uniref:complex I NDUFA9 subunit family protein n=1 Tax=Methylocapsa acidiphila TaxID=133552 RepID=UPI0004050A60|nr:complex I NDUFA9 subunit family protein [Methylocapsa acidiphila]